MIAKTLPLKHLSGLSNYGQGVPVNVKFIWDDNSFQIGDSISIKQKAIVKVHGYISKELVEKKKSTVGRAIAGSILAGGVGAVIGGVSAVGTKTKVVDIFHLELTVYDDNFDKHILHFYNDNPYLNNRILADFEEIRKTTRKFAL